MFLQDSTHYDRTQARLRKYDPAYAAAQSRERAAAQRGGSPLVGLRRVGPAEGAMRAFKPRGRGWADGGLTATPQRRLAIFCVHSCVALGFEGLAEPQVRASRRASALGTASVPGGTGTPALLGCGRVAAF